MAEKILVKAKRRPSHVLRKKYVVEKPSPFHALLLAENSHVLSRLIPVAKSPLAVASAALVLLKKKIDYCRATATCNKSHSKRKKIHAATKHLVMLLIWTCLHVEAVATETKPHRVTQVSRLLLREEPLLAAARRRVEMNAAVLVSRHAATRIRTAADPSVQPVKARCLLAAIPEALVVKLKSLM